MTFSLIWISKAGFIPTFKPDVFEGTLLGRLWDAVPFPTWDSTLKGSQWSARQIARWETKYGRIWNGTIREIN